eukprot:750462-Hanusia_phi.AAC.1
MNAMKRRIEVEHRSTDCPGSWYCNSDASYYSYPTICSDGAMSMCKTGSGSTSSTYPTFNQHNYYASPHYVYPTICASAACFTVTRIVRLFELGYCLYMTLKPLSLVRHSRLKQQLCDVLLQLAGFVSCLAMVPQTCGSEGYTAIIILAVTLSSIDIFYGMGYRADYAMNFNSFRHTILSCVDCCVGVYTWQIYIVCLVVDLIGAVILLVTEENPIGFAVAFSFTAGLVLKWYASARERCEVGLVLADPCCLKVPCRRPFAKPPVRSGRGRLRDTSNPCTSSRPRWTSVNGE